MKNRDSLRNTLKSMLANRTRRFISIAIMVVFTMTLTALVWSQPLAVKHYLGLGTGQYQQSEQVSLTLRSNGFDPIKVRRGAGAFTLSITNQTSSSAVTLHLYRSDGERVREISLGGQGSEWSDVMELGSGAYTLVDPTNPAWTCSIGIE
jgi:hypothetical protein